MFNIVKNSLNRNSFFAHSENVLLAMLADENADIRMKAVVKNFTNPYENILQITKIINIIF